MKFSLKAAAVVTAAVLAAGGVASAATTGNAASAKHPDLTFRLLRSAGSVAAGCLTHAKVTASITLGEPADTLVINGTGLPHNTGFDVFIIQVPNAPFGMSWYQGDLHSNSHGNAHAEFAGRFSEETFVVAPGIGRGTGGAPHADRGCVHEPGHRAGAHVPRGRVVQLGGEVRRRRLRERRDAVQR